MSAPVPPTHIDLREFRFWGVEAKEPSAFQRMHKRGWSIGAIAEHFRCTVTTVRHDLALP